MKRSKTKPVELAERQIEALTVAMVVAPGVYARNRMFGFFQSKGAARARARAATLRGVVAQLGRAVALSVTSEPRGPEPVYVLRYGIPALRLTRVVELSASELAALRVAADRARARTLPATDADRELVSRTLTRLFDVAEVNDVALVTGELRPTE